ncbi:acyl-CoA desaturase [Cerasicoccus arenae]|uniref:Fatty acid desaturase n=1 Tax=Cerasicoccus arenae TaxID=424488 RepID=A0A8J3DJQ7_9BACT|nr:fatty acid desaturase [Cerasicoccus arenae]MBK1857435.1 fatty acid desaturase [Cerasicoccus arenae]GHC07735.1 fatty acid desaturase [Cerasicoccus arenae]
MFKNIPFNRVEWVTCIFLGLTLLTSLTAVPWYLYNYGLDWFQFSLFTFYCIATGLSITLGYHRLFSHISFKAKWPVRLFVTLFGAAAFENSILNWCSDHRRHHKHVDHEDDPYNINNGFFYAHVGWLLFKLKAEPPLDNVADLRKDPLVVWQEKYVHLIAFVVGFIVPTALGYAWYGTWQGALGSFLLAGVLRTVCVQHATFFINSACHYVGNQPYSTKHSARDSWFMALFTFGEGYHNYHHEFQHDYRNGVKPWQFDPTKWTIWTLSKIGLTSNLREVSDAKILLAELTEARRRIQCGLEPYQQRPDLRASLSHGVQLTLDRLHEAQEELSNQYYQLDKNVRDRVELSKSKMNEWRRQIRATLEHLEQLPGVQPIAI